MYQTITSSQFHDQFKALRPNNFTYDGLQALFDYLESIEEDTEQKIEFDVISLCCEYTEYASIDDFHEQYNYDEQLDTIEDIKDRTTVIEIEGTDGFIILDF